MRLADIDPPLTAPFPQGNLNAGVLGNLMLVPLNQSRGLIKGFCLAVRLQQTPSELEGIEQQAWPLSSCTTRVVKVAKRRRLREQLLLSERALSSGS